MVSLILSKALIEDCRLPITDLRFKRIPEFQLFFQAKLFFIYPFSQCLCCQQKLKSIHYSLVADFLAS